MISTFHYSPSARFIAAVVLIFGLLVSSVVARPARAASEYDIVFSTSSNRSSPVNLDGQTVSGNIYAFTRPDTPDIRRVRYYLNNPSMSGSPRQVENSAPYDFAGGSASTAKPFKTTSVADGTHTVTAAIDLADGTTQVVHANFIVRNIGNGLAFDTGTLTFAEPVGGSPSSQSVTISAVDGSRTSVTVTDNVAWAALNVATTTTPGLVTVTVDPAGLVAGTYTGTITASALGYATATLPVVLSIPGPGPDQVHLAWVSDPSTTMTVVWRTVDTTTPSVVEYRPQGSSTWQSETGAIRPSGTTGILHEVSLESLTPSTDYQYRVRGPGNSWSQVFETRTAPAPGSADFDFVYVADTGLIGREDGLATGTQQVIDAIADLDPLLVLGGGDYAYFNTDKRFGTLDATIDAWFNQMQPIASQAPLMPAYGNHEELLSERSSVWAKRFPTPVGFDAHKNYSFDVGDVHFVAIFAVHNNDPLPIETVNWIRQDIQAAKDAGQRWIIPYMHVSPFADGSNHSSNLELRAQLGPLFESLGVQLVIASHDQSYERTYPLVNVPATNSPTSTSKTCYTMNDGVTWVKVSPGGKLSNISETFSPWMTDPPPHWTAYRDNTMHHFLRVRVSDAGSLQVEAFGLAGDGTTPIVQDSFEYTTGTCAPPDPGDTTSPSAPTALVATGTDAGIALDWASNSEADLAGYYVYRASSASGPFLRITSNLVSGSDHIDTTGPAGTSFYRVTAVDQSGNESGASSTASAERPAPSIELVVSFSSNRSNAIPLDGAVVSGNVYIYTTPDLDSILSVEFYLDDPVMAGKPRRSEGNPPFDFGGGSVSRADPFRTGTIADGEHTITALLHLNDGTTQATHATFTVANGP